MSERAPKVALGMPVYNGADYLPQTLDALLEQTFENFELVIVDNASTDETEDICQSYEKQDDRVRYIRNRHKVGLVANFNRAFRLSSDATYFKWAASDDLCAPDFLERCIAVLDEDPSAVQVFTNLRPVDEEGDLLSYDDEKDAFIDRQGRLRSYDFELQNRMTSRNALTRFRTALWREGGWEMYGLIRASALRRTSLLQTHGFGCLLLSELGLQGHFRYIPDQLFFPRFHSENTSRKSLSRREWIGYLTGHKPKIVLPPWQTFLNYINAIMAADQLDLAQKLRCVQSVVAYALRLESVRRMFLPDSHSYWGRG